MERKVGTISRGIRCPIIREGDDLASIVTDSVIEAAEYEGFKLYRAYFDGSAKGIVAALSNMGALPEGVEVNSFEIDGNTAKIDLSEEFGVALNDARTGEYILIGAVANTFIEFYGVEYFEFTVKGAILETGLTIYDFPIAFYSVS